jgi:5'(3')-deoxyribonucleotidase
VRPTVLLDIDGVAADFVGGALDVLHTLTGIRYDSESVTEWEVFDSLPVTASICKAQVYATLKGTGGCASLRVLPGAIEGVRALSEHADLIAITAPFKGSRTWAHEREEWIERYFPGQFKYVIHTRHKERVHGDVFVDDKESHVNEWVDYWSRREPGGIGIHWSSPRRGEKLHHLAVQAKDWSDVVKLVRYR